MEGGYTRTGQGQVEGRTGRREDRDRSDGGWIYQGRAGTGRQTDRTGQKVGWKLDIPGQGRDRSKDRQDGGKAGTGRREDRDRSDGGGIYQDRAGTG